jgi:AraC-like DNA-binding protein
MDFSHRVPRPPFDAFIDSIWVYRCEPRPHAFERVLPTGAAQLIVNLKEDETRLYDPERPGRCLTTGGTVLSGVQSRYRVIDTSEQEFVAGVAFKAGGTVPFVGAPACEISDANVPLDDLWGSSRTAMLRERLLECDDLDAVLDAFEAALREAWIPARVHTAVAFALAAFDRRPVTTRISAVTDAVGLSAKRFIERFKRDVGVTPKRYCRIRRFQKAVTQAHRGADVDWAHVALDCGYFDQAHFIHDFRAFAGITPAGYHAARTSFQNHVKFLQSDDREA